MAKNENAPTAPERIEIDEARLRDTVRAILEAIRLPKGTPLYGAFPEIASPEDRQQMIDDGVYLFRASEARADGSAVREVQGRLLTCLKRQMPDRAGEWTAIETGLGAGEGAEHFLTRILENDVRHLTTKANTWGVSPDSLSLAALFWARPFREEAARRLADGVRTEHWRMGFCPVCGHWPGFAYLAAEDNRRNLWCAACTTTWRFDRMRCPFCLTTDAEKLPYLTIDDNEHLPLYVCEECKRYLKHRREEKDARRDPDVDFILTVPLDYVATNQGYIQESPIPVRFEKPDGEASRAYRAKARYEDGPSGAGNIH